MSDTTAGSAPSFQTLCRRCGQQVDSTVRLCPDCGVTVRFEYPESSSLIDRETRGLLRYRSVLPVLGEGEGELEVGGTPLIRVRSGRLPARLWVKDETQNQTGSHKDRQLALALHHARLSGFTTSLIVSAGSTGLSQAAVAARLGMRSLVMMSGRQPAHRTRPLELYGSGVIPVDMPIDDLIDSVEEFARRLGLYHATTGLTFNAHQAEATKTIAFEIFEALGRAPEAVVLSAGGGGTTQGIHLGFEELRRRGMSSHSPRMIAAVPRLWNSLEVAFQRGVDRQETLPVIEPGGRSAGLLVRLAHSRPPDGIRALRAVRASGGAVVSTTDEEALEGAGWLASRSGVLVEPSGGAAMTGMRRWLQSERVEGDVVLIASGSGYREMSVFPEGPEGAPRSVQPGELLDLIRARTDPHLPA